MNSHYESYPDILKKLKLARRVCSENQHYLEQSIISAFQYLMHQEKPEPEYEANENLIFETEDCTFIVGVASTLNEINWEIRGFNDYALAARHLLFAQYVTSFGNRHNKKICAVYIAYAFNDDVYDTFLRWNVQTHELDKLDNSEKQIEIITWTVEQFVRVFEAIASNEYPVGMKVLNQLHRACCDAKSKAVSLEKDTEGWKAGISKILGLYVASQVR